MFLLLLLMASLIFAAGKGREREPAEREIAPPFAVIGERSGIVEWNGDLMTFEGFAIKELTLE